MLGAVLSHKGADGTERPIAYASRTLNASERNYSQLEKEGLACIFGIKKFHDYVFGRPFELINDHSIVGRTKSSGGRNSQLFTWIFRMLGPYQHHHVGIHYARTLGRYAGLFRSAELHGPPEYTVLGLFGPPD